MFNIVLLVVCLIFIVIAANLFCNALEHLGEYLKISDGVTGSVFAAVGTALPETLIPWLSILSFSQVSYNKEIGVGALLGAPLMLSTLSLCVMAFAVMKQRGPNGLITPDLTGVKRDLRFFLFSYSIAFIAFFVQGLTLHVFINFVVVVLLAGSYFVYLLLTIRSSSKVVAEKGHTVADKPLFLTKLAFKTNGFSIVLQIILTLVLLIYCAGLFIEAVNEIALVYKVSPFLLSLIIIPIATEMPEKINSVIWLRRKRDTLAVSNITGALVFQGSLLPIPGILFTEWDFKSVLPVLGMGITIFAVLWTYYNVAKSNLRVWHFGVNGMLYVFNIVIGMYFFYSRV